MAIPISIDALTRGFGCARDRVTQVLAHSLEPPENRGRHPAVAPEIEQGFVERIEHNTARRVRASGEPSQVRCNAWLGR